MKKMGFVVLAIAFSFIPIFLAQQYGTESPITKVEVLEEGVFKYEGETMDAVIFDHNLHIEWLGGDCASCHEGEPEKIEIYDMASGHASCSDCHVVDDMDNCISCHSH